MIGRLQQNRIAVRPYVLGNRSVRSSELVWLGRFSRLSRLATGGLSVRLGPVMQFGRLVCLVWSDRFDAIGSIGLLNQLVGWFVSLGSVGSLSSSRVGRIGLGRVRGAAFD